MLKKVLCGAAVLAASVVMASPAQAAFFVTISDNAGNSFTVNDNTGAVINTGTTSCGGDVDTLNPGTISILGCNIGAFHITLDGQTTNSPNSGGSLAMVTSQIGIVWSGAAANSTLTVKTFSDGFTSPVGQVALTESLAATGASIQSPNTVSVGIQSIGSGTTSSTIGPESCSGGSITFDCSAVGQASGAFNTGGNFSLTNILTLNVQNAASGQLSVTGNTVATVPEPGSMLLLGTGLFGLAGFARRRFNLGNAR